MDQSQHPFTPVYAFNSPGQPVILHDGLIGGMAAHDAPGIVELSFDQGLSIEWHIDSDDEPDPRSFLGPILTLRRPNGDMQLHGVQRNLNDGWSNEATFGDADTPLDHILVHWFNLPRWNGSTDLTATTPEGSQHWWSGGRWAHEVSDWRITFDVRPDHTEIWRELHKSNGYVMTHVMELRRLDGTTFTATEAATVLDALHAATSFALGRWTAPMLPVGRDAAENVVWEEWSTRHCDPARRTSAGWWDGHDPAPLAELLHLVIPAFANPDVQPILWRQLVFAITATNDKGFVEQRIAIGATGIEHFTWQALVLSQSMSKSAYNGMGAYRRLLKVLTDAHIPVDVDENQLPITARFIIEERLKQNSIADSAEVVTQVRNSLVHPKGAQEKVYRLDRLVVEAWLVTRHYLVLLILHSLGYRGAYRDLREVSGWAGSHISNVPWN
jgi:hypothetical protein